MGWAPHGCDAHSLPAGSASRLPRLGGLARSPAGGGCLPGIARILQVWGADSPLLLPSPCCRLYVPRVQDKEANMHFLHLDGWGALQEVPPFGIREPRPTYDDGRERQDVLLVGGQRGTLF